MRLQRGAETAPRPSALAVLGASCKDRGREEWSSVLGTGCVRCAHGAGQVWGWGGGDGLSVRKRFPDVSKA